MPHENQKTVVDAQKSVEQAASIAEHLFRAPDPVKLVLPILLVSLLAGMTVSYDMNDLYQTFIVNGIMLLALPAFVSGLLSTPFAAILGGRFYLRRSILLSFLTLLIVAGVMLVFWLVNRLFAAPIPFTEVLIFAYCAIIWLRHLSLVTISNSNHLKSLPASLIQPVLGLAMIAVFFPPFGTNEIVLAVMTLIIFLISVILLTEVANAPLRRAFGINGLTMARYSLDHITEGGDEGAREVEAFFNSFSEKVDAHIGLVSFKKGDDIIVKETNGIQRHHGHTNRPVRPHHGTRPDVVVYTIGRAFIAKSSQPDGIKYSIVVAVCKRVTPVRLILRITIYIHPRIRQRRSDHGFAQANLNTFGWLVHVIL